MSKFYPESKKENIQWCLVQLMEETRFAQLPVEGDNDD